MTHLNTIFFQPVSAVDVGAPNHQHVALGILVSGEQRAVIISAERPRAASARSVEMSRRAARTFPDALRRTDIKRILQIFNVLQFFKFDGNIGADFRVVLYEGDVWESLKKEIVAISFTTIIYRPLAFLHI